MKSGPPPSEIQDMRAEMEKIEGLFEGAVHHSQQHEDVRALRVFKEYKRRRRDLDIRISFWESRS